MAIKWGPERSHDGSDKCPEEARDVPCSVRDYKFGWFGLSDESKGQEWHWHRVTAYRLPADVPMPAAADPVRDALVDACQSALDWFDGSETTVHDLYQQLKSALALAKGAKP